MDNHVQNPECDYFRNRNTYPKDEEGENGPNSTHVGGEQVAMGLIIQDEAWHIVDI